MSEEKKGHNRSFRFTDEDLEILYEVGEKLTERNVFGLKTAGRGINLTAVIRYLAQEKLLEIRRSESKE